MGWGAETAYLPVSEGSQQGIQKPHKRAISDKC